MERKESSTTPGQASIGEKKDLEIVVGCWLAVRESSVTLQIEKGLKGRKKEKGIL